MSISNIKALIAEFEIKRQELQAQIRESLKDAFTEFFNAYPEVDNINFAAFVPYFNDGEECVFSIQQILFSGSPELQDSPWQSGFYFSTWKGINLCTDCYDEDMNEGDIALKNSFDSKTPEEQKRMADDFGDICSFINSIEDFIREICGSHVRVKIDRQGIHVEEYEDHD